MSKNVIGAVFKIKDQFSSVVSKITGSARESEKAIKQSSSAAKDYGKGFDGSKVSSQVDGVKNSFDKAESSTKKATDSTKQTGNAFKELGNDAQNMGSKVSSGFGSVVKGAASIAGAIGLTKALTSAFNMVKGGIDKAFERIDVMEQFERTMTTITGSAEDTKKALERTTEAVTGTGYGLDVAAKSVQDFVTRGMDINKATDVVETWGDAVAFYGDGSNDQLARVSDALGKMTSKGKVEMDQMNTLFDAGIDGVGMYAQATGKNINEVQKALSKGEINAESFIDVVTDAMQNGTNGVQNISGAAKEAGASWGAAMDNMKARVAIGVTNVIKSIDEMLESKGLPQMRDMVETFGNKFRDVLNGVADYIPIAADKVESFYNKLKDIGAVDMAKSAFESFKDGLALVKDNMEWLIPIVAGVVGGFTAMKVASVVTGMFSILTGVITAVSVAGGILNAVMAVNPFVLVGVAIAGVVAVGIALYKNWDVIKEKASELWTSLTERFNSIRESVVSAVENTKTKVVNTWENIKTSVSEKVESMRSWVSDKFQAIRDKATGVTNWVKDKWNSVTDTFDNVKKKVSDMAETIKEKWNSVKTFLKNPIKGTVNLVQTGSVSGENVGENYMGTSYWRGGLTTLHEKGEEIYDLPGGTRVYPHGKSLEIAREEGRRENNAKGTVSKKLEIVIAKLANQIIVREEADIDKIAKALVREIENANLNMP